MRIPRLIGLCCVLAVVGVIAGGFSAGWAAEEKPMAETGAEKAKGMPFLDGTSWKAMSQGEKVAFVLGIGHVVTVESDVVERRPELKRGGFVAKMSEGLSGMSIDDVIAKIDGFYAGSPESLKESVMRALWDSVVKPRIKTGIVEEPKVD